MQQRYTRLATPEPGTRVPDKILRKEIKATLNVAYLYARKRFQMPDHKFKFSNSKSQAKRQIRRRLAFSCKNKMEDLT